MRALTAAVSPLVRLLKHTSWLTAGQAATSLANFVLAVFVIRAFGATEYGRFAFALAFVSLFGVLFDFGLATTVTRELSRDDRRRRELGTVLLLRAAIGTGALLLVLGGAMLVSDDPVVRAAIGILGVYVVLLEGLNLLYAAARARQRMDVEAGFRILHAALLVAAVAGALALSGRVVLLATAYLAATAVAFLVALAKEVRESEGPFFRFQRGASREFMAVGWHIAIGRASGDLVIWIDSVFLGLWLGTPEVGWYNAAARLNMLVLMPMGILTAAFFPMLVRARSENAARFRRYWERALGVSLAVAAMAVVLVMTHAEGIVALVYGVGFAQSAGVLRLLVLMAGLVYVHNVLFHVLLALDDQKATSRIMVMSGVVSVVANVTLIPRLGMIGAAVASVLTHLAILLQMAWRVRRTGGGAVAPFVRWTPLVLAGGAAAWAVSAWLAPRDLPVLVVLTSAGAMYFFVLLALAGAFRRWVLPDGGKEMGS